MPPYSPWHGVYYSSKVLAFWNSQKAGFLEGPENRCSGKARKQVSPTSEVLAATISTEPFRPSGRGVNGDLKYLEWNIILK